MKYVAQSDLEFLFRLPQAKMPPFSGAHAPLTIYTEAYQKGVMFRVRNVIHWISWLLASPWQWKHFV